MAKKYTTAQIVAHYASAIQSEQATLPQEDWEVSQKLSDFEEDLRSFGQRRGSKSPTYNDSVAALESWRQFREQLNKFLEERELGNKENAQAAFDEAVACFDKAEAHHKKVLQNLDAEIEERVPVFSDVKEIGKEDYKGKTYHDEYSKMKSAAAWIEQVQAPLRKKGAVAEPRDAAIILAARQLANCKLDDLETLQAKQITEAQLLERADAIMAQDAFKDFVIENSDAAKLDPEDFPDRDPYEELEEEDVKLTMDPSVLTAGHGGKLETAFGTFIGKRDDVLDLPERLFGRYQTKAKAALVNTTYEEYIDANKKDLLAGGKKIKPGDPKAGKLAAAMMAAFLLKEEGRRFNTEQLERRAKEYYNSPEFQYLLRNEPKTVNQAASGDFEMFSARMQSLQTALEPKDINGDPIIDDIDHYRNQAVATLSTNMMFGVSNGTRQEKEAHKAYSNNVDAFRENFRFRGLGMGQRSAAYKKMGDYAAGIFSKADDMKGRAKDPENFTQEDMIKVWTATQDHLKELKASEDPVDKVLAEKLTKVLQAGAPYFTQPEFSDKKGKTAAQQQKEYEEKYRKAFLNGIDKYRDDYNKLEEAKYNKEWKPADAALRKAGLKPMATKLRAEGKKINAGKVTEEYMAKRGPKFRAMVESAREYSRENKPSARKTLDLVNKILSYQDGKEKLMKGNAKHRFDDSMSLLAAVTAGTPLEQTVLQPQIDKINKIRGAKAGDPSFIRKEDYFDDFKQEINLAETAKKLNEEIGDIVKPKDGRNNPVL